MYRWSDSAGRFTDARTGRFVAERSVRAVIDKIADGASDRMEAATQRLLANEISLASWQTEMAGQIRLAHAAAAILAHGGREQMDNRKWLAVGRTVKAEYRYLREFAAAISDGRQPLNGTISARARQYGQGARVQFERVRGKGQQERGYTHERNVLGSAEHCRQCRNQTERGTVEIGSLVPVGKRSCRSACRCSIRYEREPARRAAA